jgi:undecaprenyl diphosphate synthase
VKYLTIWGFSTENWKRPEKEREAVFSVIEKIIGHFSQQSKENKIQFIHLGRKDRLPKSLINKITALEKETQSFNKFHVQLCLDYGGRDEIIRAVKKSQDKNIDENSLPRFLDTANIPDPDLIIRTGGERRLSGFLPFQSAYSELYFTDVFFPEFDAKALRKAVAEFSQRQRRFGE